MKNRGQDFWVLLSLYQKNTLSSTSCGRCVGEEQAEQTDEGLVQKRCKLDSVREFACCLLNQKSDARGRTIVQHFQRSEFSSLWVGKVHQKTSKQQYYCGCQELFSVGSHTEENTWQLQKWSTNTIGLFPSQGPLLQLWDTKKYTAGPGKTILTFALDFVHRWLSLGVLPDTSQVFVACGMGVVMES